VILTRQLVLLNYPRTGSTFVRQELRRLYGQEGSGPIARLRRLLGRGHFRELALPIHRTASAERTGRRSQHGALCQIPASHAHLPVVSVWRSPLDRAVSQYEHGFWRQHPPGDPAAVRGRFPRFPDLDFAEYLALQQEFGRADVLKGRELAAEVGPDTLHLVRFFTRDPEGALDRLDDGAVDSGALRRELAPVRFLRFSRLAEDLAALLVELGFAPAQVAHLADAPRVNAATSRGGRPWSEYFTPELEAAYRRRERFLFALEEELDG
jgi:hypothetical protein